MENTVFYECVFEEGKLLLFSEYHGLPIGDFVVGKPVYVQTYKTFSKEAEFKTKKFPFGDFLSLAYRRERNGYSIVSDREMCDLAAGLFKEVKGSGDSVFSGLAFVGKRWIKNVYEPRECLIERRKQDVELDKIASSLQTTFGLKDDEIGVTGSTALGASECGDYDFVFYGNCEKLLEVRNKIDALQKTGNEVEEYGFFWPARFYLDGKLVCCFFNYEEYYLHLIELFGCKVEINDCFSGVVADDSYGSSKNAYFSLKESSYDGVLLMSNLFKNAIRVGERLSGKCFKFTSANGERVAVCINPVENLDDALRFFKKRRTDDF